MCVGRVAMCTSKADFFFAAYFVVEESWHLDFIFFWCFFSAHFFFSLFLSLCSKPLKKKTLVWHVAILLRIVFSFCFFQLIIFAAAAAISEEPEI